MSLLTFPIFFTRSLSFATAPAGCRWSFTSGQFLESSNVATALLTSMAGYSWRDKAASMVAARIGDHSATRARRIIHAIAGDILYKMRCRGGCVIVYGDGMKFDVAPTTDLDFCCVLT